MDRPNDNERQERIEAYLSGKLGGEDLRAFEQALSADEDLHADVEIERVMRATVEREPEMNFRDLVRRASEEQENADQDTGTPETPMIPIDRKRIWTWMAAAASIALILATAGLWYQTRPDYQDVAVAVAMEYEFSALRDGGVMDSDVEKHLIELSVLMTNGANHRYLARSEELLSGDSLLNRQYGDRIRLERSLISLRIGLPKDALKEIDRISDKDATSCELEVVRGLAAAQLDQRADATKHLTSARMAGCISSAEIGPLLDMNR